MSSRNSVYLDEEVLPCNWEYSASARLGPIRFGKVKRYTIETLNLPGVPPSVHGEPPFVATPYTYQPECRDVHGSLGPYEWTRLPQYVENVQYAVPHRAFVTPNSRTLAITSCRLPKVMTVPSDGGDELVQIEGDFLSRVQLQSDQLRAAYHSYSTRFRLMGLQLASPFDFEWALGRDWSRLTQRAQRPFNMKELREWTHDVRRRMLDTQAFVEFSLRQVIHHVLYIGAYEQPVWPTEARFVGVIVDGDDDDASLYGTELARLGAPVWRARVEDRNPRLTIMPPNSAPQHPLCRALWSAARRQHPTNQARAKQQFHGELEHWAKELQRRGFANPDEIWWIRNGDPRASLSAGVRFNDPTGISAPSRVGIKVLFANYIVCRIALIPGVTDLGTRALGDRVIRHAAFLSQTFGIAVLPHQRKNPPILGIVPALFQDNRERLQSWSIELFPVHSRPPVADEPRLPPKADTIIISSWLQTISVPSGLTLGVIDRLSVADRPPRGSARARSPEPEDRRIRRRVDDTRDVQGGGDDIQGYTDVPETWSSTYADPRRDIASRLAAGWEERQAPTLPVVDGHIYIILVSFPALRSDRDRQLIFYDRFGTRGASGYGIVDNDDGLSFHLTLQFEAKDEWVARSILENQSRAGQWFSGSEPAAVYAASHPAEYGEWNRWDPHVISAHGQLRQEYNDARRRRFMIGGAPVSSPAAIKTLLGPRFDGRQDLHDRLNRSFNLMLPVINPNLPSSFFTGNKVEYPKGSSYIVMTRYRMAPCMFMDLLQTEVDAFKRGAPLTLTVRHPLDNLLDTLAGLMARESPPSFRVPIPGEGPYRDVLQAVASRYKMSTPPPDLGHGSFADEFFIYEHTRAEFEITLCDLQWNDIFDAAL